MKTKIYPLIFLLLIFAGISGANAQELTFPEYDDQYTIDRIITGIQTVVPPYVSGDYAVFTAATDHRYVGIAFEFEDFATIHPLEKLVSYDYLYEELASVLFYILPIPENCSKISYRMVIDGLWTTDKNNPQKEFDFESGTYFSTLAVDRPVEFKTQIEDNHVVKFVYEGESGKRIRLGGNFTNWDSFIYYLQEIYPGRYELALPLPSGTWYYAYYTGMNSMVDTTNPHKVYTPDGRMASVIIVD
ncbi:MAG: isoamylase [Treponemataceae bacterium]|nr:isoamylase [Treponemataceae bacterium]